MLPSVDLLNKQLLALSPVMTSMDGATQFINTVANFMDQMQAGTTGSPGIFTYTKPPAIAAMMALPPAQDQSWIMPFANAIHLGATAAILVPGTAMSPAWTSSVKDIAPPVIITLPVALTALISGLQNVTSSNNPAMPMAQAISDYAKAFTFLCTGLFLAGVVPTPLPLPFPAQ